jgi:hypothetical protein
VSHRQKHGKEQTRYSPARHGYKNKENGRDRGHDEEDDDASRILWSSRRSSTAVAGGASTTTKRGHITKFYPRQREGKALMADANEEATLL